MAQEKLQHLQEKENLHVKQETGHPSKKVFLP
jgi:hypothetical protein